MAKFKRKYKILLITVGIIAILIISCYLLFSNRLILTRISYGNLYFDKNKEILVLNDILRWDTGANGSVIFNEHRDKIAEKQRIGLVSVQDSYAKKKFVFHWYLPHFNLGNSMKISRFFFSIVQTIPLTVEECTAIGIIGMDVIGKANWIIDFNSGKIDVLPQNKIYKIQKQPRLTLKYKYELRPETQLDFSICQFENVLIDAGFDNEISLFKSDIEQINKKHKPVDTLISYRHGIFFANPVAQTIYIYDSLQINNICFNNVRILEEDRRSIGLLFFKRFNKLFLNSKEKAFYFYEM